MEAVGFSLILAWLIPLLILNKIGLALLFRKAGIPLWNALIPFWNWFAWSKMVARPWYYGILIQIPVVGVVIWYTLTIDLLKSFGRNKLGEHFLGLVFQPFYFLYIGFKKDVEFLGASNTNEFRDKYLSEKKNWQREWADAILFAVVVAYIIRTFYIEAFKIPTPSMEKSLLVGDFLFVSKVHYGSRVPMTPLAIPFAHQDIMGAKIYTDLLSLPYMRFPALESIKRNTPVVFNFPDEDHPIDKKTHYIKRCVAIPGDTLQIIEGQLYINGKPSDNPELLQFKYNVRFKTYPLNQKTLVDELDLYDYISYGDIGLDPKNYEMHLTQEKADKIGKFMDIHTFEKEIQYPDSNSRSGVYPNRPKEFNWTVDFFGPLYVPKKGVGVEMNRNNYLLYEKIIRDYEKNHSLIWKEDKAYIDGKPVEKYVFKMDYYWMMGDNRHNSLDSRSWGFVPEDHIVGKPLFIWFSIKYKRQVNASRTDFEDKFHSFRWNRIFKKAYE